MNTIKRGNRTRIVLSDGLYAIIIALAFVGLLWFFIGLTIGLLLSGIGILAIEFAIPFSRLSVTEELYVHRQQNKD